MRLAMIGAVGAAVGHWIRSVREEAEARHAALLRRDRILEAVGTGAERLLRLTNGSRLDEYLALVGEATGTSRAYIFQNHEDEHGHEVASQRFEWVAPGVPPQIDNPDLQAASYEEMGMERWRKVLARGGAIMGRPEEFPESERKLLEVQRIRSLVVLPIFIGSEWWGFIGFDETQSGRDWSRAEIDALRTSAGLVAAAIERERAKDRIRELERTRAERQASRAAERRSAYLAEASRAFGSTLEYGAIFEQLARLAVPRLGPWCIIDRAEDGSVRRTAVEHADPRDAELAERLRRSGPSRERDDPIAQVLAGGPSRIVPAAALRIPELVDARGLGERSAMVVPLRAKGGVAAAMTVVAPDVRGYTSGDLAFADELAGRASLALENARLYDQARRATRVRDEMLAVVSHDLRNPLNTISLSRGLLAEMPALEEGQPSRQLEIIGRSVERAERLIEDLLDVARIESGTFSLECGSVSGLEVAREALDLHRGQAEAEDEHLVSELPEELPDLWADRDRVLQVFGNLLGNAIKFTPEGGRIALGAQVEDGRVRYHVSDSGPGIPEDQRAHLFDPFWQAAQKKEGAGLGLAIARGIVEQHGGSIGVESEVGGGTTVSFTIPTMEAASGRKPSGAEQSLDAHSE